jgi:hypothetical protein
MVTQEWAKDTVSHYHLLIIIYIGNLAAIDGFATLGDATEDY